MNENEIIHDGVPDNTNQSRNGKGNKKRKFNDFEIESYADEDIIEGIIKHYPDDIENSIIRFDLVSKYLITDKNVLYATHNFTRGYTCDEKIEYRQAHLKFEEYTSKLSKAKVSGGYDEKVLKGWKKKFQEYLDICYAIDTNRKQKRLTRLSDRATVAVSFNDTFSFSDEDRKTLNEKKFKIKVYDIESRKFKTTYIEYTGLYFLINRNALITSILQGKLCHKGKVWQDGVQKNIKRGRPYPEFTFIDSNGDIHSYETMKQAAKEHFDVSTKTLYRSLKAKCGNDFIICGETYSLLT